MPTTLTDTDGVERVFLSGDRSCGRWAVAMEITAKCPYCQRLNTYQVKPNVAMMVTCTCRKGSFYVKKVDRVEVVRNSLWAWDEMSSQKKTATDLS